MVIDTGSALNVISDSTLKKLNSKLTPCSFPILKLVNNQVLTPLGKTEIKIKYLENNVTVYVFKDFLFDVLLGLDWCSKSKISINFNVIKPESTPSESKIFPFSNHIFEEHTKDNTMRCYEDVCIDKLSGKWVEVYANEDLPDEFRFEPDLEFYGKIGLMIFSCLIKRIEKRRAQVFVANPYCHNKRIRVGTSIGHFNDFEVLNVKTEVNAKDKINDVSTLRDLRTPIKFNVGDNLSETERERLNEFLQLHRHLFACNTNELTTTNLIKHKIDIGDNEPIHSTPYRTSPGEREAMAEQIADMLKAGLITESKSPFSSPVVMVKKRNGKLRFCVDYRKLNAITKKDVYPLPRIDNILDALKGSKLFSLVDMASGYWQIELEEEDMEKTAFTTIFGLYHWKVVPFGLCSAPATYQRMVDRLLAGLLWRVCLAYLDDVIIYSKSFEDHLSRLREVFSAIDEANLRMQPEKCEFGKDRLKFLGHIVTPEGTQPDPDKIKSIMEFPTPRCQRDIRSFHGLCSYYRNYIKDFSYKAEPLLTLLRKNKKFTWEKPQSCAFEELKLALVSAPVLVHYDPYLPIKLYTDASYDGLGYTLKHVINDEEYPIKYGSRTLSDSEVNYGVTELECLVVVWSICKNREYLLGKYFEVVSDHHSLCWMMRSRDPCGKLARWSLRLQEYDFKVIYKCGKKHKDVDALSRNPLKENSDINESEIPMLNMQIIDLESAQRNDVWCRKLIDNWEQIKQDEPIRIGGKFFVMVENVLYRKIDTELGDVLQLVVPKELRKEILFTHHNDVTSGHLGVSKTWSKLRLRYFWPKMYRSVVNYIRCCIECQMRKSPQRKPIGYGQLMEVPIIPFSTVGIDLLGRFPKSNAGNTNIVVCIDHCTRYVVTKALVDIKAETVAKFLIEDIVLKFGAPDKLISDQGTQFTSALMQSILHNMSTAHIRTSTYHPMTNGAVENFNKTLANMLSQYCNTDQKNWCEALPYVTFAFNTSVQESSKFSPYRLLYGREARLPVDSVLRAPVSCTFTQDFAHRFDNALYLANESIVETQRKNKSIYDAKRRDELFSVGEEVLVYTPIRKVGKSEKLLLRWFGPFTIIEVKSPVNYKVENKKSKRKEIVHVSRMKRFYRENNSDECEKDFMGNMTISADEDYSQETEELIELKMTLIMKFTIIVTLKIQAQTQFKL